MISRTGFPGPIRSDGLPYYTMPFIEGESLRAKIAHGGPLPVNEAVKILRDTLSALSYAHGHGVVHRDIKPDNILLTDVHAVVADFGVAKALSASTNPGASITSLGMALGTPAYMSPEQAAADPTADHRSDLYAVGAVGYEMLTGQTRRLHAKPSSKKLFMSTTLMCVLNNATRARRSN